MAIELEDALADDSLEMFDDKLRVSLVLQEAIAETGPHAATHANAGADEINVAGLSGVLADPQTPAAHAAAHANAGADEISVLGLSGLLADPQLVQVAKADVLIATRKKINLIAGAGVSLTVADNPGSDQVDVTIVSSVANMFFSKPAVAHADDAEFEDGTYGPYGIMTSSGWTTYVPTGPVAYATTPSASTARATANYRGTYAAFQPNAFGPALTRRMAARPTTFQLRTRISLAMLAHIGGSGGSTVGQAMLYLTPEVAGKPDLGNNYVGIGYMNTSGNTAQHHAISRQSGSNVMTQNMTALQGYEVDGEFILLVDGTSVEYWFRNEVGNWRIGAHSTTVAAGSPLWIVWLAAPGTTKSILKNDYIRQQDDAELPF